MVQIRANSIAIEYDETGPRDGVPLLLIMGFGRQMTSWPEEFRPALARSGLRVIRFDNRDVGLTQKWDGILPDLRAVGQAVAERRKPDVPYDLADMAADAAALLEEIGVGSAHILGVSMGGMIAQLVALNHPQKTRSLISVMSTTSDPSLSPAAPRAMEALTARPPSHEKEAVIAHTIKARRVIGSPGYPADEAWLAQRIAAEYDRAYYPEGTQRHWAAIMATPPRTARLKSLDMPALVLHGAADILIPPDAGRHTAACIPNAEYHEIEGWGHDMVPAVVPVLVARILPFIRKVEIARGNGSAAVAIDPKDPAAELAPGTYGQVRAAGPESMRDSNGRKWDAVDEASDESFPASDPPPPVRGTG